MAHPERHVHLTSPYRSGQFSLGDAGTEIIIIELGYLVNQIPAGISWTIAGEIRPECLTAARLA